MWAPACLCISLYISHGRVWESASLCEKWCENTSRVACVSSASNMKEICGAYLKKWHEPKRRDSSALYLINKTPGELPVHKKSSSLNLFVVWRSFRLKASGAEHTQRRKPDTDDDDDNELITDEDEAFWLHIPDLSDDPPSWRPAAPLVSFYNSPSPPETGWPRSSSSRNNGLHLFSMSPLFANCLLELHREAMTEMWLFDKLCAHVCVRVCQHMMKRRLRSLSDALTNTSSDYNKSEETWTGLCWSDSTLLWSTKQTDRNPILEFKMIKSFMVRSHRARKRTFEKPLPMKSLCKCR